MQIRTPLIAAIAVAGILTLGACAEETGGGEAESAPATDAAGESGGGGSTTESITLAVTDSGWLTVGTDGAVQTTFFDEGGRYRDLRNGAPFAQGSWEQRPDGTICFEPDSGLGACWETEAEDENGLVIATNGDGKSIEIKRVTYLPPPAEEEAEAESDADPSGDGG
ncbi:hypothetical protein NAP1_14288 [Erythrobacter sp. NAP1]|uniref:hypothetical protein n=1 Tax=Erythrobacter sp. NAP1 TaxID=237727 RepID=UPI000068792E|nr:hypothetical protein [Erythrobacter sp. NAP1]EAQ28775.1 hypothetical protein NAP1_14288 [Erythrobacter sp. NAP1]